MIGDASSAASSAATEPQRLDPSRYSTLLRLATDPGHKLVLCLGGGGVPGLTGNVALVSLMEELGLRAHVAEVWGTSAGAVVGGGWATGTSAATIFDYVLSLHRKGAVDWCWRDALLGMLFARFGRRLPEGLVRGRHFANAIAAGLSVATFEECAIPFRCIAASDDGEARRRVFRRGPLLPAIFSSITLPGIVVPRERLEDETCGWYDGGIVEKTPLISPIAEHHRAGDPRKLLLLCTHFGNDAGRANAQAGFVSRFLHTIYALENLAWHYQLAEARSHRDVVIVLLDPRIDDLGLFDFSRADAHHARARAALANLLQDANIALTFGGV